MIKHFKNTTKSRICYNDYVDNNVKGKDHCHITGKYRNSSHRDCNINLKLNHKIMQRISQPKNLWFPSYYARTGQTQS